MASRKNYSEDEKHNVRLSKALSWLLRHNLHLVSEITKEPIDESGYVDVESVLKLPRFAGYSVSQVEKVVELNDKQRFSLRKSPDDGRRLQIRANQGHTVKDINPDLKKITDPDPDFNVIHGTYEKHWNSIETNGLSRMARNHIHFAKGLAGQTGVISGMRQDCNVHIYVHVPTAMTGKINRFQNIQF
jgi:2'-phosphotransferase